MKAIQLSTSEQMLFTLLRASLHETDPEHSFFRAVSANDWKQCYKLASNQGVMALAWDSVLRLPKDMQPPLSIKITWAAGVEAYEKKYLRYCSTINEVSRFYNRHGISVMQLKGVGFSTLYPVPCHREGGDIDIYTYSADKNNMTDKEANRLADILMQQQGINVDTKLSKKHSNFYYKGIPFENHKTFLNVKTYKTALQADNILHKNMHPTLVPLAEGEIMIPSREFNTLFISFHAMQHYGRGLAIHHLCDWAIILLRYGLQLPEEIKDTKFLAGIAALTQLCNKYLGTSQPIKGDESIAIEMMNEIMYPRFLKKAPTNNKIKIIVYKTRRLLYLHKISNKVLESSLIDTIFKSIVAHILKPSSIFD